MGKIKKTDEAAKTAEAWWALLIPEGSLGRTIYYAAFPIIGGGAGAYVASATDWISSYGFAGWAATIAVGGLTAIWGMAGWAHWRSRQSPSDLVTEQAVGAIVSTRLEEFLTTRMRAEFITQAQSHAQDERIAKSLDAARAAMGTAQLTFENSNSQINEQREQIGKFLYEFRETERKWETWTQQHAQNNEHRFKSVDAGFRALRDREVLLQLTDVLHSRASWLLRTTNGEKVDDWGLWNHRHFEWRRAMTDYSRIAARYVSDAVQSINEVPPHTLKGEWPEDRSLFPSDDAMIEHRTTAVIMRNFSEIHPKIIACVESFAFQSPSMKFIP